MKYIQNVLLCLYFSILHGLANPLILKSETEKYECVYTAVLELDAMGRFFGVDALLKGTVTPHTLKLVNELRESKNISTGQKVIVFGSKDGSKFMVIFLDKHGKFKLKIDGKEYHYSVEDLKIDITKRHDRGEKP